MKKQMIPLVLFIAVCLSGCNFQFLGMGKKVDPIEVSDKLYLWAVDLGNLYADNQLEQEMSLSDLAFKGKAVNNVGIAIGRRKPLDPMAKYVVIKMIDSMRRDDRYNEYQDILNQAKKALKEYRQSGTIRLYVSAYCSGFTTGMRNRMEEK